MMPQNLQSRRSVAGRLLPNIGLAVLGLLVTHETAYSLAAWLKPVMSGDGGRHVDHAHQSLLVAAGGTVALWLTAWFVVAQLRNLRLTTIWGANRLSFAIAGLYLVQESIEIAAAGPTGPGLSGLVANRAVVIGLLLAPPVAWLLRRALHRAEELVQAWLARPAATAAGRSVPVSLPLSMAAVSGIAHEPGDPRGPPARDVTTAHPRIS